MQQPVTYGKTLEKGVNDMTLDSKRVDYLDIAKFIAITIVCLGHIGLPKTLSNLIHIFHMPVFFIVSGMCYNENKYQDFSKFICNKIKTLLIPSFVWSFFMYIFWRIYCIFEMRGEPVSVLEFFVLLLTKDANASMFGNLGVIQWFFTSLFFAEILFWLLLKAVGKIKANKNILLVGGILLLIVLNQLYSMVTSTNRLGIGTSIMATVFLVIGYLYKINKTDISLQKQIISFLVAGVLLILVWRINGETNMRTMDYNNVLLFIVGAVSGSYIIIQTSRLISAYGKEYKVYKWMLYIGRNTLIVLIFNRFIQFTLIRFLNYLLCMIPIDWNAIYGLVLMVAIDLFVEMLAFTPVIWLINRYIPFTVGRFAKLGAEKPCK